MKEELDRNEDVIFAQQSDKVMKNRGYTQNRPRSYVNAPALIIWMLLALAALCLWLLRLFGVLDFYA